MKQYKNKTSGSIYTVVWEDEEGALVSYPSTEHFDRSNRTYFTKTNIKHNYVEHIEPVKVVRYGRAFNASKSGDYAYWALERFAKSNIKATWIDGVLTHIELV